MMKIDVYSHIMTPKYLEAMGRYGGVIQLIGKLTSLWDVEQRLRVMDKFEGLSQVLVPGGTSKKDITPEQEAELAKIANDEVAEIVAKYPDRFVAAAAVLPLKDIDLSLKEADRAINVLKLRGVHIPTPILGKAVDRPEFFPIFEAMCRYDLPIWLHPSRPPWPEYPGEEKPSYDTWLLWGWPYESTLAMTRMVLSKMLLKLPSLKVIIHHAGAMVPFFSQRIVSVFDSAEITGKQNHTEGLPGDILDYFRKFYVDTAVNGNTSALMCSHGFYGADHILFGTDMPFDSQNGFRATNSAITAIESMNIPEADKVKIFRDNTRKLLKLN
ncbi:MAG: amidohydrolase family protein [Dehalococcoidia bacterium]|nr:amidohydrolase family protein [Dehalococcoidia bacterium]MDZ4247134.1 amidohydrolase family protein [Dehalococcoidia bacterium]